jgi:transposase-like protein
MSRNQPRFTPPHCTNRSCEAHRDGAKLAYVRTGSYQRVRAPFRVQRFRCKLCGVYFSEQSFRETYWLKRPELPELLFFKLLGCSSFRQIGRDVGAHHSTVARLSARLGRRCLLLHESLRPREPPDEPVVLDGFEIFEHSQYHPYELTLLVGSESRFWHEVKEVELRRSGRMRPDQKRKRARLEAQRGRPDPRARLKTVRRLLEEFVPPGREITVLSDKHPTYPVAMAQIPDRQFHRVLVSSKRPRTPDNPLDPVNEVDRLLRHGQACHKRETIAFSKRRQSGLERAWCLRAWKNYGKGVNEAKKTATPAQRLGLLGRPLSLRELLGPRLFPDRVGLGEDDRKGYEGRIRTRALPRQRRHELKYAY